jgi:hypothetical protein
MLPAGNQSTGERLVLSVHAVLDNMNGGIRPRKSQRPQTAADVAS